MSFQGASCGVVYVVRADRHFLYVPSPLCGSLTSWSVPQEGGLWVRCKDHQNSYQLVLAQFHELRRVPQ